MKVIKLKRNFKYLIRLEKINITDKYNITKLKTKHTKHNQQFYQNYKLRKQYPRASQLLSPQHQYDNLLLFPCMAFEAG